MDELAEMEGPKLPFQPLEKRHDRSDVFRTWLPRIGVGIVFILIGANKFASASQWVGIFDQIGFGQWFRYFTGVLQIGGGVMVLLPWTFVIGILILAATMLGAMGTWVFLLGSPFNAVIPGAILAALLVVGGEELIELGSRLLRR